MIHRQIFRTPAPGKPMVLAAFSFRHDAHLVPDLIENVRPGVHGCVMWDDRGAADTLSDETTRRQALLTEAQALGADWLLTPDPDERFERGIESWLPDLLEEGDRILWSFQLHELFSPTEIRTDGLWGRKTVLRLFPIGAAMIDPARRLHGRWAVDEDGHVCRHSGIGLFHLRMALPARRQLRRDLYAAADPERKFQAIGYDYLSDEREMVLEPIPPGRGFHPPFVEDHGLWSPPAGATGEIRPDPYEVCLTRAARSSRRRGQLSAHHVMDDLFRASPQDNDLRLLSARFACDAQAFDRALHLVDEALAARPDDLYPRILRARALIGLSRSDDAGDDIGVLDAAVPGSPLVAALACRANLARADLMAPDAAWRGIAPGDATIREGLAMVRSDLATVVIGFRNQPGLPAAVQSLLDQDEVPEVVVVNSGGGRVAVALAPFLDRIRLITCETPLQVGAARNIGIAASRAPFVAFLAGDCRARPGWVAGRLARHRAGALAVSSAVVGEDGTGPVALAANRLHYSTRHPLTDGRHLVHYGLSYSRDLLDLCGAFPPGLAATEDTVLNRRAARFAVPAWAPDVVTVHRDATTLIDLLRDERRRGLRRSAHLPYRSLAAEATPALTLQPSLRRRLALAECRLADEPGLSHAERRCAAATLWLAAQADRHGLTEGFAQIRSADALLAEAAALADRPEAALEKAEAAWALDPEDQIKARRVGELRRDCGDKDGAMAAFRAALSLDPADSAAARSLVELVALGDGAVAALAEAERRALAAPLTHQLWALAAERAGAAGLSRWAVALGQIALGGAADQAGAHARLSALHLSVPDPLPATFRRLAAARLAAAAEARRPGHRPPEPIGT
ncbi:glycosyltransferase family 2 protein [Tabrizicola sp. YIM 78059]|uniref:glycosyltransferase family 2 protein n=1 Tax=Tabrizicola sp. YIM 78059 TaxID=2529861 RepID=UPI0010AB36C0|nr:glycosyltransferase family 2 protein [Tabrizicola sp. YIM 78059]